MDICDEIRIAWAEWTLKHKDEAKQVILPSSKYQSLERYSQDRSDGFCSIGTFCGMKVYAYEGDEIVFS